MFNNKWAQISLPNPRDFGASANNAAEGVSIIKS